MTTPAPSLSSRNRSQRYVVSVDGKEKTHFKSRRLDKAARLLDKGLKSRGRAKKRNDNLF